MLRVISAFVYLLLLSVFLLPSVEAASLPGSRQPNILLLLADDLGYNDSGLYRSVYRQEPVANMPALESLAKEGLRFSRFYTESTCSASRVALLTGQYPARQGFIPAARGISPDVITLPEYLRAQGYVTHHVGKWHVGEINREAYPAAQGFDSSFGFLSQWMLQGPDAQGRPQLKAPTYYNPWLQDEKGHLRQYQGHLEDLLTAYTVQKIQKHSETPWFIYHAFLAPHAPLQADHRFSEKFPATREGKYLAMLAQLDDSFAKIFSALKASGQWDNTIIIVASDNGSMANHGNSNAPFAGGKAAYDEGGIRAPLVIKWHSSLSSENQLRTDPVSVMDIYASLRSLLGDQDSIATLDGQASLLPESEKQKFPSLNTFYTFDAFSIFDPSGQQRLIQEWDTENFTRREQLYYDEWALPSRSRTTFWERWFTDKNLAQEKRFTEFLAWRDRIRQVPVKVSTLEALSTYHITGSDFLRTPINPAYALAFSVIPQQDNGKKILLLQQGTTEVVLEHNTLRATVHGMQVKVDDMETGRCYTVVLSGAFYDRYSTVQDSLLPSRLYLVVDGMLKDSTESVIESLADVDVKAPHQAQGISAPRFFTTQLLPADKPIASHLEAATAGMCVRKEN